MLNWLRELLTGKSTIKWATVKRKDAHDPAIKWEVTRQGKLLFRGSDMTPLRPLSKADLEASLQRLKEKIAQSGYDITIEALYVETHIATGLWNENAIDISHLQSADGRYNGLTFEWELLGEPITLSVQTGTYYEDYEFIVRGHPLKQVRVRDLPDRLAEIAGEKVF